MKAYVVFSIAFLFSVVAECQTEFGGVIGLNYNKFVTNHPDLVYGDLGSRADFHIGTYLKQSFTERFYLTASLNYEGRGGTVSYFFPGEDTNVKVQYLSIPVIIGYRFVKWCNIELGPSFSYRLSTRIEFDGSYHTSKFAYLKNDFDFGATAGVSFNPGERLRPYLRFYRGFIPIEEFNYRDDQNNPLGPAVKQFNQTIQAGVAIMIKRVGKQSIGTSY